jgi:glycosyltransferase involved in cell wall biosynthesis
MKIFLLLGKSKPPVFILRLCEALVKSGDKIYVIGNFNQSIPVNGVYHLDYGPSFLNIRFIKILLRNIFFDIGNTFNFIRTIINKDIVRYRKYQILMFDRRYSADVVHVQWASDIIMIPDNLLQKTVVSLRGRLINSAPLYNQELKETYANYFPKVNAFHGVSKAICKEAARYGAALDKCMVVYSGLELEDFPYLQKKKKNEIIKIISVGRPHWKKGYSFALDAFRILYDRNIAFEYVIIGGDNEEILYQKDQLGLSDHVQLVPRQPFQKVRELIQKADLLILPSVEEGIANVVLESMALGTPVLSTDCGGMNEVLKDGENGWLVPVRDPYSMADNLQKIAEMPLEQINKIALNARRSIEENHTQEKMIKGMTALYSQVVKCDK